MRQDTDPPSEQRDQPLPIEVEIYIEPDGTVTFADLAAEALLLARALNPDQPLVCDVPDRSGADNESFEGRDEA